MAPFEPTLLDPGPIERVPQDVVVYDRTARRWAVRISNTGQWVGLLRGPRSGESARRGTHLVTAFDPSAARNLSDALTWAASIAAPRELNV